MRKQRPTTRDAETQRGEPEDTDRHTGTDKAPGGSQAAPANQPGERPGQQPRSGEDTRQRGWFWHWNGIITQYAPLIGLKGVGLLNSYTAWTDRRENSPHRGYAFPGQQAEAAFYGEDRAELITINKILVALDLIEIRKEMVEKADTQGRRWKVPHNFYRVKDRADGLDLTTADVLRVVELAERDRAVYRYIRKVFSPKFAPIDRNNIWHQILREVQTNPTWQKLAEKTAKQEARASARSKAGHRSRAKQPKTENPVTRMTAGQLEALTFDDGEQSGRDESASTTSVDTSNNGSAPDVAGSNRDSRGDVDEPNSGSGHERMTSAAQTNSDPPSVVEPGNTMYYQEATTTTTTTTPARGGEHGPDRADRPSHPVDPGGVTTPDPAGVADDGESSVETNQSREQLTEPPNMAARSGAEPAGGRAPERGAADPGGWGPLGDPSALVVSLFEAANDRKSTRLERILLSELERDAAPAAEAAGSTGADWVAAALREAVGSGSSFVAPKRIREIVTRWAAEGAGPSTLEAVPVAGDPVDVTQARPITQVPVYWIAVLESVKRVLDDTNFERLLCSSTARRVAGDRIEVVAPSAQAAGKLDREYRPLIERHLARELGRPVDVTFVEPGETSLDGDGPEPDAPAEAGETQVSAQHENVSDRDTITISPADEERGRQLWRAVLHDLGDAVPAAHRQRLNGVIPLGQNPQGSIILGAPNRLAIQHLTGRYRPLIEDALATFLGQAVTIDVLGPDGWSVEIEPGEDV